MKSHAHNLSPNIAERCPVCRMHMNLCFCSLLQKMTIRTRVIILMQFKEKSITTNTAHLVPKIFPNAQILYRGHPNKTALNLKEVITSPGTNLLLYPLNDTNVLTPDFAADLPQPVSLFVPDGNWKQTLHMVKRSPELMQMKKVTLPIGAPSAYRLRKGPTPNHLCTYEAIARALGVLENDTVQKNMESIFNEMVTRVLWTRGKVKSPYLLMDPQRDKNLF